jgi:hypothetical protein
MSEEPARQRDDRGSDSSEPHRDRVLPTPDAWKVAAYGLAIYGASRLAAVLIESASMAAAVASAVIAEWGAGRLGVAWSDVDAPPPTTTAIAKRALLGASVGAAIAGGVVVVLSTTHAVSLARASSGTSVAIVAIVTAGLLAMRDELLLHGVVLRAILGVRSTLPRVVACAVTSGAAAYGDGATARGVFVQAALGLVFGALWIRDRGAWMAWGAHTAWLFTSALLLSGGLFDARVAAGSWGGGAAGALAGSAAVVALVPVALGVLAWAARRDRS